MYSFHLKFHFYCINALCFSFNLTFLFSLNQHLKSRLFKILYLILVMQGAKNVKCTETLKLIRLETAVKRFFIDK